MFGDLDSDEIWTGGNSSSEAESFSENDCDGNCLPPLKSEIKTANSETASSPTAPSPPDAPARGETSFVYAPIKAWQFRILCLKPGLPFEKLEGCLAHATLALLDGNLKAILHDGRGGRPREYRALSYTWGKPDFSQHIYLDGLSFPISSNLDACLRNLRSEQEELYIWIDALCINQQDLGERAQQVSNMLQIYQVASEVYVWLGISTETLGAALKYLQDLWRHPHWRKQDSIAERVKSLNGVQHSQSCHDHQKLVFDLLSELYNLPWFKRVWVRQEIFAAKAIRVHCGSWKVLWSSITTGGQILAGLQRKGDLDAEANHVALQDLLETTSVPANAVDKRRPPRDLIKVLSMCPILQATDPRDLVYAILGMCAVQSSRGVTRNSKGWPDGIDPDYTASLTQVWARLTIYMLQLEVPLRDQVFNFVASKSSGHQNSSAFNAQGDDTPLPTWVMDWRFTVSSGDARILRSRRASRLYPNEQCVRSSSVIAAIPPRPGLGQRLILDGCFYAGVVAKISEYTCDLEDFVYRQTKYDDAFYHLDPVPNCNKFSEVFHSRKVAWIESQSSLTMTPRWGRDILLEGAKIGNSLVPSTTLIGDIIVIKSATMLPLVLNPVNLKAENFLERANELCRIQQLCDQEDNDEGKDIDGELEKRAKIVRERQEEVTMTGNEFSFRGPLITVWHPHDYHGYERAHVPESEKQELTRMDITLV